MKNKIFKAALNLTAKNGKTTTLEVKNEIHRLNPGCGLTQVETSKLMNELSLENDWQKYFTGTYFEYKATINTVSQKINFHLGDEVIVTSKPRCWNSGLNGKCPLSLNFPFTGTITLISNDCINIDGYGFDIDIVKDNLLELIKSPQDLTVLDGISNIGKLSDYSVELLKQFKDVYVCSTDKIVPHLYNTQDRFEARKMFKAETNASHNDVRMKKLNSYLKSMGV